METFLRNLGFAAFMVFSPDDGRGKVEAILGLLLVLAFIACIFIPHENSLDTVLIALVSSVVAFYFGQKVGEYNTPPRE